jgi:MarR family transcriptional regulator, 2-MHQ and catechol-resistance regulon repressor
MDTIYSDTIATTDSESTIMPTLSRIAKEHSRTEQPAPLEDMPFVDAITTLLKVGFLIGDRPEVPSPAYQLNLAETDVLAAVGRAPEGRLDCSEIGNRTLVTKGGITKVLDRLEARGLVRRTASREDRRNTWVGLSVKGVEFVRRFFPRSARGTFEKAFRVEQMREFSKLLARFLRSLEADSAKRSICASERNHGEKRISAR